MLFTSITFLFYFLPAVLVLYYAASFSKTLKNIILTLCSLLFYTWGEPVYILLLLLSICVDYCFGILIHSFREKKGASKALLAAGCAYHILILFGFKYLGFVLENIFSLGSSSVRIAQIAAPVGISFYTFQSISYLADIRAGRAKVQKNPLYTALYVSFFPVLLSGPILQYHSVEGQLRNRRESFAKISSGACRVIIGLAKKVLISNQMAIVSDRILQLHNMGNASLGLAWLGAAAYTLQIFFDFSSYSDTAIGLGLMFGFEIDKNFNYPYISKSIGEFWRRWHISLGNWFKQYVYFPLGGSRVKNKDLVIRNLAVVWILTGVWHGANWTFLMWGMMNFLFIAFERVTGFEKRKLPAAVKHLYTMLAVVSGWVIFRAENLQAAGRYLGNMFNPFEYALWDNYVVMFLKEFGIFFLAALILCFPLAGTVNQIMAKGIMLRKFVETEPPFEEHVVYRSVPFLHLVNFLYPLAMLLLFAVTVTYIVKGSYNPFIYFQF